MASATPRLIGPNRGVCPILPNGGTAAITKLDAFAVQSYMGHQHYSDERRSDVGVVRCVSVGRRPEVIAAPGETPARREDPGGYLDRANR